MKVPENEIETIIYFFQSYPEWELIKFNPSSFPDATLYNKITGESPTVEFEYRSSSFIEHEHNPSLCDMIICWKNDFPIETHFPIWELSTNTYPKFILASPEDELEIKIYTDKFMRSRGDRRKTRITSEWRKVSLSDRQKEFIVNSSPKNIVKMLKKFGILITPRTASNWRVYAAQELGIKLKENENV